MTISIVHGIADIDAKGTTGVGTIHFIDVTLDGVLTRTTYGLIDVLEGRFNKEKFLKEIHESNK